ncbi:MAG TPA: xanthine dehydrogenase family protein subunit M [Bacillota bacterium]|nr:xanthine dehydrogenase family protein subunit M [Bacillota bacterium]HQC48788.1 xanthine dehydrogenase family protein subunit M [Bacillota bacterium]
MLSQFDYVKPLVLNEALAALAKEDNSYVLAGGTDLMIMLRHNAINARHIIDIKGIPELNELRFIENEGLTIGANVVVNALVDSELVKNKYKALHDAASCLASFQLRNRATLVGNICNASPGADLPPALLVYDAVVKIASVDGVREVPLVDFFTGVKKTVLTKNELVLSVFLPDPGDNDASCYLRQTRLKGHDLSTVGVACRLDGKGKVAVAIGAVAPTPLRLKALETAINEKGLSGETILWAADAINEHIKPISDVRSSEAYRRHMASVLLKRCLVTLTGKEV